MLLENARSMGADVSRWLHWRYMLLAGRARKRARENPRRERVLVRTALTRSVIRYKEICSVVTNYSGSKGTQDKAVQSLDFCCYKDGIFFVLLFHPYIRYALKDREVRAHQSKVDYLEKRGTPYLVLGRKDTSQMYQVKINIFLYKCKKEYPKRLRSLNE